MQPFELVGPSYTSQSPNLADMLTMNWYPESSEGMGQAPAALYPTPGLEIFSELANTPIRGEIVANDRGFVVAGSRFFEIFSNGSSHQYGTVINDSKPVSMAAGSSQILIASAGFVYVFDFSTGLLTTSTLNVGGQNGVASSSLGAGGTGYAAGDQFTINTGNSDAVGIVDTLSGSAVATYHLTGVGTSYAPGTVSTTNNTGTGSGLTIDILTVGGGYVMGDTGVVNGGSILATYIVTTVDANGNVTSYSITSPGTGYIISSGNTTATGGAQPGIGTGFTINVTGTGTANNFITLPNGTLLGAISFVAYVEGFFLALLKDSNQFQWSALLDASTWDPIDTNRVSVFAGNVLSMFADHNEIWFWGERQTQPYSLTGSVNTFDPITGAFMEAGIFAPDSPIRLDNSIFWLGGDERGAGVVWRANGYTPSRVSNHAIEFALQGYLTKFGAAGLSDAVGYSYQDQGHGFYVLYFPTANATWVLDTATGMWHQRGFWNAVNGTFSAHHSQNHMFIFGKHLVGDWSSGNVYNMSISIFDDAGNPIRRVRRTRHASSDQSFVFFKTLQLYVETGVGPIPPLTSPSGPAGTHVQVAAKVAVVSSFEFTASGASVLGHSYSFSVQVTNNAPTQLVVGMGFISTGVPFFVNQGETKLITWSQVGDGANFPFIQFYNGSFVNEALDFTALNPSIIDTTTSTQLIPTPDLDFSTGWVANPTPATITQLISTMPRDPMINLRWSNDGGHVWSPEFSMGIGQAGKYGQRVMFRRLGRGRSRVWEVSGSDPVPYRLIGAYLDVSAGEGA